MNTTTQGRGWKHDELASDLAQHLVADNRMVWTDMQMGPSGSARPDVYTMQKSYTRPRPISYEIKVSRSDFLSDVNAGKWQKYLDFSGGVIFAVPHGLVTKAEVPFECGLIVRGENGWRTLKREKPGTGRPGFQSMMKLVIDGIDRCVEKRAASPKVVNNWTVERSVRRDLGDEVADVVRDHLAAANRLKLTKQSADADRAQAAEVLRAAKAEGRKVAQQYKETAERELEITRVEAARALGLPENANWQDLRFRRRDLLRNLSKDGIFLGMQQEIRDLRQVLRSAAQRGDAVQPYERNDPPTDLFEDEAA
ncbi:MAG: hypothetical protein AAFO74_12955 [Pseudomonadota bacterium]